ncbi:hypothetical protein EV702DRAFT_1047287 [Suillus placidus]|uniref:Uncharacterized protein n=1 Tax=Suillus placidus TaxID=48579 RepID=A0A9P6ZRL8_9AGAM|nr:hypothetical protein EV702DRAFT_1047287 [Suillus placidus]
MRAPYAPPAIRQWVQAQENQPQSHDIDCQRFANRRGIRHDNKENLSSDKALHEHFCLNKDDRELAFHEGMSDVKDAAIGMGRIADILFIVFGLRPEWDPTRPMHASDVQVEVVTSRQFEQFPHFKCIASKLQDIFMQELSVAHIWNFRERLNQVTPGPGYVLDPLTRQLMTGNVRLAAGQTIPNLSASTPTRTPQRPPRSQTSNLTQSVSAPPSRPYPPAPATSTRTVPPSCPYPPVPATSTRTAPPSRPYPPAPATSTHTAPPSRPYPPAPATPTRYHDHTVPPTAPPSRPHPPAPATLTQYRASRVVVVDSDSSESESNSDSDHSDHGSPPIRQLTPAHQPTITPHQLTSTSAQSLTPAHQSTNARELSSTCQPTTTARIARQPVLPRPSWIVTPPGSPSVAFTGDIHPPEYYINPDVSLFNFTQPVQDFLRGQHASAAMLCKVNATLDYGMDCWVTCFQEAGLSFEDASSLRTLIVQGLSHADLQVVLAGGLMSKKKKVVRTNEQCKLSKANSEAMWDDIAAEQTFYLNTIKRLAKKYHTSPEWMSGQMYLGGKLQKKNCNVCVFNAVVSDKIRELRENVLLDSGEYVGRDILAQVTREVSKSGEWKMLSTEEKEELLEHIQDGKDSKAAKKVTGLKKRTGCNLMWILTRGKVGDIFPPAVMPPSPSKQHFFIFGRQQWSLSVTSGRKSVDLKAEIREMIRVGMHEILTKERGVSEDDVPAMTYTAYEGFVVKWGVELVGWTEGQVTNPGNITSSIALARLHAALKNHDCDWRVLSADEWEVKKDAHQQQISNGDIKQRAMRSDKGSLAKAAVKSSAVVGDTDEEDKEDIEDQRHADEWDNMPDAADDSSEALPDSLAWALLPSGNTELRLPPFDKEMAQDRDPRSFDSTSDGPLDLSVIGAQADTLLEHLAHTIPLDQLPFYVLP